MRKIYPKYKDSGIEQLGEMPEHWGLNRVKHIFCVFNGATPKSNEPKFWGGDVCWVTPEDLGDLEGTVINSTSRRITQEGYQSCGTTLVPAGNLVLSTRAPIGHIAQTGVPLCTNQGCRILAFKRDVNHKYFFYEILCAKPYLQSWGEGSTFMELSKNKLEMIFLAYPPKPEQEKIASFLDDQTNKIDELISKKERQINLMKEKRAAVITRVVLTGLDPNVPTKESGIEWLGEIPAHWQLLQIRRVMKKFVDYRGKTPEKVSSGIPLITAANVKNGFIDFANVQEYVRVGDYDEWMGRGLPELGDVLITTEAPLGEVAQINNTNIALAQRIIMFKVDKQLMVNEYLKYFVMSGAGSAELITRSTGSTALGIKAWHLKEILITIPPLIEQRKIIQYIDQETSNIDKLISKIQSSIDKLKEYRSALISAAVTGKIDVRGE